MQRVFRRFYKLGCHGTVPSKHTVNCWINNFEETRSDLKKNPTGRSGSDCTPQNIHVVCESVLRSPQRLICKQAAAVKMSREGAHRILTVN